MTVGKQRDMFVNFQPGLDSVSGITPCSDWFHIQERRQTPARQNLARRKKTQTFALFTFELLDMGGIFVFCTKYLFVISVTG